MQWEHHPSSSRGRPDKVNGLIGGESGEKLKKAILGGEGGCCYKHQMVGTAFFISSSHDYCLIGHHDSEKHAVCSLIRWPFMNTESPKDI